MAARLSWAMAILLAATVVCCNPSHPGSPVEPGPMRGKYLVENIGMCADCHTPRNDHGEPDRSRWLQGAPLNFRPVQPLPDFSDKAPGIAGLPRLGDAAVIKLLQTGLMPNGQPAKPPMPQYRLSERDAAAVADYLKSLPAGK